MNQELVEAAIRRSSRRDRRQGQDDLPVERGSCRERSRRASRPISSSRRTGDLRDLVKAGRNIVAGSRADFIKSTPASRSRGGRRSPTSARRRPFRSRACSGPNRSASARGRAAIHGNTSARAVVRPSRQCHQEPKADVFTEAGRAASALIIANGKAEIGVQQITELLAVVRDRYIGPLPPALQTTIGLHHCRFDERRRRRTPRRRSPSSSTPKRWCRSPRRSASIRRKSD